MKKYFAWRHVSAPEDSDSDVTPLASFITTRNWNSEPMEPPTELRTCIEEDITTKGLTVDLTSTLEDKDNEIFNSKWRQI